MTKRKKLPSEKDGTKLKEQIQKYEKYLTSFKTVKTSLKSIVKNDSTIEKINEAVYMVNNIVIHTYQFFKLYYLDCYHNNKNLPVVNTELIKCIMKTLCIKDTRGKPAKLEIRDIIDDLTDFNKSKYEPLRHDNINLSLTHLNTVLDYESASIITGLENHIVNNFYTIFASFVNSFVYKNDYFKYLDSNISDKKDRKRLKSEFCSKINKLKKDLLDNKDTYVKDENGNTVLDRTYYGLKCYIRKVFFSNIAEDTSLISEVKKNPLKFLPNLIKMNIELEKRFNRTFNCFPLRRNISPKYIKLDTTTLIHLLFDDKIEGKSKQFYLTKGNTHYFGSYLWSILFRTERKHFKKKNYEFNCSIVTDGFACSILFLRKDLYNKNKSTKIKTMKKPFSYTEDMYMDDLSDDEKKTYKELQLVGIDPGKHELLYATKGDTTLVTKTNGKTVHKTTTWRYTQSQRRKETKSKKYSHIRDNDKKNTNINGITIKELESVLSNYNSKSCNLVSVTRYINCKNKLHNDLVTYYQSKLYRRLKWYSFINRQRTDDRMINNFEKVIGKPEDTVIAIGDYCQKKQLKYSEPTKGKSYRKLFKKVGYKVFLIYEKNTSKMNAFTGEEMEKFRKHENPRPFKEGKRLCHGLLRSKTVTNKDKPYKHSIFNRNFNGSSGIYKIASCILDNKEIPEYYK